MTRFPWRDPSNSAAKEDISKFWGTETKFNFGKELFFFLLLIRQCFIVQSPLPPFLNFLGFLTAPLCACLFNLSDIAEKLILSCEGLIMMQIHNGNFTLMFLPAYICILFSSDPSPFHKLTKFLKVLSFIYLFNENISMLSINDKAS